LHHVAVTSPKPPSDPDRAERTQPRDVPHELENLARRALEGDRAAFNALFALLRPEIVRVTRLIVGPGSWSAEDAAQEACLDILEGLRGLRDPSAVRTWSLRIASRRALKQARRDRLLLRRRAHPDSIEGLMPSGSTGAPRALIDAFYGLPPRLRVVAVLRLFAGVSEQETADILQCPVGTVKSQLNDARGRLVDALQSTGIGPSTQAKE
jgi:RNA polymerase sigma factor (sigma-70 family)